MHNEVRKVGKNHNANGFRSLTKESELDTEATSIIL